MNHHVEIKSWNHLHAGHCESGVTAALLQHIGLNLSEPMVFGLGAAFFFGHFKYLKVMGLPITTFRTMPGSMFSKVCGSLGVPYQKLREKKPDLANTHLIQLLDSGQPVGMQVNIYWLPYVPDAMRIHFNAHNLIVIGYKRNSQGLEFKISDPVSDQLFWCSENDLNRARFSKGGPMSPRGLYYFPGQAPSSIHLEKPILQSMRHVVWSMLFNPFSFMGIRGIFTMGARVTAWFQSESPKKARLMLAQVIRMQEEIGTGGAGFRYLYAAFLQESEQHIGHSIVLKELSSQLVEAGDRWREFALIASRICKNKDLSGAPLQDMLSKIDQILKSAAIQEKIVFERLWKEVLQNNSFRFLVPQLAQPQ